MYMLPVSLVPILLVFLLLLLTYWYRGGSLDIYKPLNEVPKDPPPGKTLHIIKR